LFHGVFPSLPKQGERLVLGSGMACHRTDYDAEMFGVKPIDGRSSQWLNIKNLYRVHSSVVELWWEPKKQPSEVKPTRKNKRTGFTMIVDGSEGSAQVRED
jgi:hypothetical protein